MIGAPLPQEELNKRWKAGCANIVASLQQLRTACETLAEQCLSVRAELARISRLPPEEQERFKDYIEKSRVWVEEQKLRTAQTRSTVQGMLSIVEGIKQDQLARLAPGNNHISLEGVLPGEDQPPKLGEFLICLFVCPGKQDERLADFKEYYHTRFTSVRLKAK